MPPAPMLSICLRRKVGVFWPSEAKEMCLAEAQRTQREQGTEGSPRLCLVCYNAHLNNEHTR